MIILCLGSNLGDRLSHLRLALHYLRELPQLTIQQVSPVYISDALMPENAPPDWDTPYLNVALRCETTLSPHALLTQLKETEKRAGRLPEKVWGPRIIDIDLLAWDDLVLQDEKLHIPHKQLEKRPFALWPLADVAPFWVHPNLQQTAAELVAPWRSRFTGEAPFHTRQIAQRIDTPQLMGILNATPDSFSDGGKLTETQALELVQGGAEILDIGAEATHPRAQPISVDIEWQRLEPVLTTVLDQTRHMIIQPQISIDTRHASTAARALALGATCINDVSGLQDPAMREIIVDSTCDVVVMHHLGIPVNPLQTLPKHDPGLNTLLNWAEQTLYDLTQAGIALERVILDVGIGFGKTSEQSFHLLQNLAAFRSLGARMLVGHSRKRFLERFTNQPFNERDLETVALSMWLAEQRSVDILRVHQPAWHARAFKVMKACFLD